MLLNAITTLRNVSARSKAIESHICLTYTIMQNVAVIYFEWNFFFIEIAVNEYDISFFKFRSLKIDFYTPFLSFTFHSSSFLSSQFHSS